MLSEFFLSNKITSIYSRLKFTQHALNELENYFEFDDLEFSDDGWIYLTKTLPEDEWVYRMILSLGDQVEVLEPQHIREFN